MNNKPTNEFVPFPKEDAIALESEIEAKMEARTIFYGTIGSNTVWGFSQSWGHPGVAITNGIGGQVVVNLDNLKELVRLMETAAS